MAPSSGSSFLVLISVHTSPRSMSCLYECFTQDVHSPTSDTATVKRQGLGPVERLKPILPPHYHESINHCPPQYLLGAWQATQSSFCLTLRTQGRISIFFFNFLKRIHYDLFINTHRDFCYQTKKFTILFCKDCYHCMWCVCVCVSECTPLMYRGSQKSEEST